MNHGYSKPLKIVSVLLLIAMLTTSQTFIIFAEEAAEHIAADVGSSAALNLPNTEPEDAVSDAIVESQETAEDLLSAEEMEEISVTENAYREMEIIDMQRANKTYSTLAEEEKNLILTYLSTDEGVAPLFAELERLGYPLFRSVLIVQMTVDALFTLDQAIRIYELYPERRERDQAVRQFRAFAACFDVSNENIAQEVAAFREEKAQYVSAGALENAKNLLFAGYSVKEIRAAYSVAATFDLAPEALLNSTSTAVNSVEAETFVETYPVDLTVLNSAVSPIELFTDGADTLSTATEAKYYSEMEQQVSATAATLYSTEDESQYEVVAGNVAQPFNININERENVNLNTGALEYTEKLLTLPGVNNQNFNLSVLYNSAESTSTQHDYYYKNTLRYKVTYTQIYYIDYYEEAVEYEGTTSSKTFGTLAAAQEFQAEKDAYCKYIQKPDDNYEGGYAPGTITYATELTSYIQTTYYNQSQMQTFNEKRYDIGCGWSFNIPSIDYGTKSSTIDDRLILPGRGTYSLRNYTFYDYALDDMDLSTYTGYNNGQFDSYKKLTFADGTVYYFNEDGLMLAAVDRFGNTVTYKYALVDEEYHPSEIIDSTGTSTTIAYADAGLGKTVTITVPDGNTIVLHIGSYGFRLEKIVYPDGETTYFTYAIESTTYNYAKSGDGKLLQYVLLKKVKYDTGAELRYVYTQASVKLGVGKLYIYRLTDRYTLENADDSMANNRTTYAYTGNYTTGNEYRTKVTDHKSDGKIVTQYTFSDEHLCTKQEIYDGATLKTEITTEYDNYDLPQKVVTNTYGSATMTTTELYKHDKYGNTLTYTSPKAEGSTGDTEYRTTYTYNSKYQLPLTVEYKQDASTTIKIKNIFTSDAKNIEQTNTYVNDVLVAKTVYTYNAQGQVVSETVYPDVAVTSGITKQYAYDGANLVSTTVQGLVDADGTALADITVSYTYDTMGRPLTETDANGNTTAYTYDSRGRVTSVTAPDGSITAYTYNLVDNRTSVASSEREPVVYNYDGLGQLESVVYSSGDLTVENFYDAHGRLVAETTNRESTAAGTTYYTYDAFDRITEKAVYDSANKLTYRETYAYDDAIDESTSLVTKTVHGDEHAADIVTKTYTNKYGETVKEDVGGVITQYEYDYVGNPIRVYYGNTTLARYTYDYAGNVLTETNPDGYTRNITYDDLGRKLTESDFKGNVTSYTYDNAGRLLVMTAPLTEAKNSVTKYYYDANGNILKQQQSAEAEDSTDPVWRTVEQTYDSMNRVTDIINHVSDSVKQYTHYAYNLAGDLTDVYTGMTVPFAVANPDSYSHIEYTYDRRGNNTAITDALGQTESYTYDVLGMLTHVRQRNGLLNYFAYNASGNVTQDNIADLTAIAIASQKSTAYTLTGAVKSVTIDGETVEYTYDGMGNIRTETEGNTVKSYTYDSRGRKSGYTLTIDGEVISSATYAYDTSDRLTSVTEGGKTTTYTYDENGNRASQTTDGVTTTYTYNKANLVTGMVNKMGDVVISSFTYTYYADGNMYTKAETQLGTTVNSTYVYDGLGKLRSETKDNSTISYYYDSNGNRTLMNNDGVITSYTYDKNNRLLTEGDITYTYDENGNTLTAGNKTYTYNARGQQIGYSEGTTTASYAYNPSGLRSAKTVGGSTKYFVYNGMQIVFEYEDSISDGTTYYYGLNRTHSSDGDVYIYNAHGDTVQLVNDDAVVVSYTYDAFGNLINTIGESDNAFRYCSEYFDAETQTYYLRARYYNPANGRFTQQDAWAFMDASDPLSLNLYTYCANNPVAYLDPSGHAWYHWALGAVVVAACAVAVVATAGGAAAGIAAVAAVANGAAAATAASTVAAGAFIGSAAVYGTAALYAAGNSSLESPEAFVEDFNEQGNWGTVVGTAAGAGIGAGYGYSLAVTNNSSIAPNYGNYAKNATHNSNSSEVVLGKYNANGTSYVNVAKQRNATYFSMSNWDKVSKKVGVENMWKINESFLQQQLASNKSFILSHDPSTATGYFAKEVEFLTSHGFRFIQDGDIWRAIK